MSGLNSCCSARIGASAVGPLDDELVDVREALGRDELRHGPAGSASAIGFRWFVSEDITFVSPESSFPIPEGDLASLIAELGLLARDGAEYDAAGAGHRIDSRTLDVEDWARPELQALVRALNHLPTPSKPLRSLRDAVTGFGGFERPVYELRLRVPNGTRRLFQSSSGSYNAGDRLVHGSRLKLRVICKEPGLRHERLICE